MHYKKPKGPGVLSIFTQSPANKLEFFYTLADGYGEFVKVPSIKRTYLLNHPDYLEYICHKNRDNYLRGGMAIQPLQAAFGKGILVLNGEEWLKRRRTAQPIFQPNTIINYADLIINITLEYLILWENNYVKTGKPFDLAHEIMKIVLSIATDAFFSYKTDNATTQRLLKAILVDHRCSCSLLSILPHWTPTIKNFRYHKAQKDIRNFILTMLAAHPDKKDAPDLLELLLHSPKSSLTHEQVVIEAKTFLLTGHETTGSALSWAFYLLLKHPEIYAKLQNEIDSVLGTKIVTYDDIKHLPYNTMCFKETLRLFPPIWITGRKAIADDEIDGYFIKKNSDLLICPFTMHRNKNFWPNVDEFIPERFTDEQTTKRPRYAYIPFGAGPRSCIAGHFAMMEAALIMAIFMQKFEFELVYEEKIQAEPLISLRAKNGIWVKAKKRP